MGRPFSLAAAALAMLAVPAAASAHVRLVASNPAASATVSKPKAIRLSFSEPLVAPLSGIELVMTGMPGMANHAPMPIRGFTTAARGKDLVVTMPRALPVGTYRLSWHAVAADQHRVEGSYSFSVR